VVPRSVLVNRRARRGGGVRLLLLAALVVALSSCASGRSAPSGARVLGQPSATTLVVGQPAPEGTGQLGAVSCPTARRCWAVGVAGPNPSPAPGGATVIVATADGGTSWKAQQVTGGSTPQLSAIACPSSTQCMAVGSNGSSLPGSGVVVTTSDAGRTWSPATAPANVLAIDSVACASPADCTAIVNSGTSTWSAHSHDFGASWQQEGELPASLQPGDDLTCVPGGTCLVPGYIPSASGHGQGAVAVSSDGGQTWVLATVPTTAGVLQSVACLSASDCLAAGSTSTTVSDVIPAKGELVQSADGGHTWTPSAVPVPVDDVYGLACPSIRQCVMVGTNWVGFPAVATGAVAQSGDGGAHFGTSSAAYIPTTLSGLSCPDTMSCVAVGGRTVAQLTLIRPRHRTTGTTSTSAPGPPGTQSGIR